MDNCLGAVVCYKTAHKQGNGRPLTISYGLDKHVVVNTIISLPTLQQWQEDIQLSASSVVAEAETGGLFYNAQTGLMIQTALDELGHLQPTTHLKTDNSTATSFANSSLKQKQSKS